MDKAHVKEYSVILLHQSIYKSGYSIENNKLIKHYFTLYYLPKIR